MPSEMFRLASEMSRNHANFYRREAGLPPIPPIDIDHPKKVTQLDDIRALFQDDDTPIHSCCGEPLDGPHHITCPGYVCTDKGKWDSLD